MDTTRTPPAHLLQALKELGRRVRHARQLRNFTLESLAEAADVGMQTLVRIEEGNPGVGALNLQKVLAVLNLSLDVPLDFSPPREDGQQPLHTRHARDEDVQAAVEAAASAACKVLDQLLGTKTPEKNGISSNFQGLLAQHLERMLCGSPGLVPSRAPALKRLVYSDAEVGGPRTADESLAVAGWALRLRGQNVVWQDGRLLPLDSEDFDPWSSRHDALEGFRLQLHAKGHPPGVIDAVPVYFDQDDRYLF